MRNVAGARALAIDGKVDASNAGDMLTQRLLGLLPVLLHPEPRDALVIGLGSGVTADAVLASSGIRRLDVVESHLRSSMRRRISNERTEAC